MTAAPRTPSRNPALTILRIEKLGSEVLGHETEPITAWDEELRSLVEDMQETMLAARGVGLAANQVGISRRVAIIDLAPGTEESELHVLTNPEILETDGAIREDEGCLSVPGLTAIVERPERVVARYRDLEGVEREMEGTGLMARALCHEIDHLNGMLYVQRVPGIRGDMLRRKARKMQRQGAWEDVHP